MKCMIERAGIKIKSICLILTLGLLHICNVTYSYAANEDIPKIVTSGLNEYKNNGPEAAINAWIKGSPYEGSKEAASQANSFKQVETFYGKYVDFNLLHTTNLGNSTKLVYLIMNFEKGPLFATFLLYRFKEDWILSGKFNFNTEPKVILPNKLLDN